MKIGLLQFRIERDDPSGNEQRATNAIFDAAERGAELLVLPELWKVGYFATEDYQSAAESLDGPTLSHIRELANDLGVAILAGSIIEDLAHGIDDTPAENGLANTSVLFDSSGTREATYRKHHLFGYGSEEADLLTPGKRLETATIGDFTVGITTCYDLRFPELYRELLNLGVTLVLVPSAWPYPRVEHWKTLTAARALENLFYVAAVNGTGPAGGDGLIGRSRVVDPWGVPVRTAGPDEETLTVDLEPDRVRTVRDQFPALRDRRS
jgi:predicted amidohydrolase